MKKTRKIRRKNNELLDSIKKLVREHAVEEGWKAPTDTYETLSQKLGVPRTSLYNYATSIKLVLAEAYDATIPASASLKVAVEDLARAELGENGAAKYGCPAEHGSNGDTHVIITGLKSQLQRTHVQLQLRDLKLKESESNATASRNRINELEKLLAKQTVDE